MPDKTDLYRGLAVIALVVLLPWIAGLWAGGSVLGFPWPAFVMLLGGPALMIVFAGGATREDVGDMGDPDA